MTVWWRHWVAASRGGREPPQGNCRGSEALVLEVKLRGCARHCVGSSAPTNRDDAPGKDGSELADRRAAGQWAERQQGQERHHEGIGLRLRRFRASLSDNDIGGADISALVREGVSGAAPKSTAPHGRAQPAVTFERGPGVFVERRSLQEISLAGSMLGCVLLLRCLTSGGTQGQCHRIPGKPACLRLATAASTSVPSSSAMIAGVL